MEFHPQLCQTELRSVCKEYGVCFQAYSSLGRGELLSHPVVLEVAKNCDRTPAQVKTIDKKHLYKKHFMVHLKSICAFLSGVVALGCATGCPGAPQIIQPRQDTEEHGAVWLFTQWCRHGQTVSFGLWPQVLLGPIRCGLTHRGMNVFFISLLLLWLEFTASLWKNQSKPCSW